MPVLSSCVHNPGRFVHVTTTTNIESNGCGRRIRARGTEGMTECSETLPTEGHMQKRNNHLHAKRT